ncbi:MAG: D-alanyl-D-alanine carboxypeptidase [PS1 clade bacterium]|nr:D-alanyl-D-alanine carboxypeptidase [PS1 clade bacterium]CAI8394856.1 MAG: D-alanyl-D-alanine carboxypeptidase DacC [Rhodobiaceae bacterium UBA7378]
MLPFVLRFTFIVCLIVGITSPVRAFESAADYALVMDAETGVVLFEKNADAPMSPASMSKLMTVLMVFEALRDGVVEPDTKFRVSDDAWRRGGSASGGSTMFLNARSKVSVLDLLRGVVVQSGNDACIALAEGLAGSEDIFAELMTERAIELGLKNSSFANATGLPDPSHKMTARDLALLARIIIQDYSTYYSLFSERAFTWNGIRQNNRNPLLYADIGADGLKTGHTKESGYGLVASAEQGGRRLIVVLNGLTSKRARAAEARKMMNYGFRSFTSEVLVDSDDVVSELAVWHGAQGTVSLVPDRLFKVVVPRGGMRRMAATVTYEKPVLAPIKKGDKLGMLRITLPGLMPQEMPLVAAEDVARGNMVSRAFDGLGYLLFGD